MNASPLDGIGIRAGDIVAGKYRVEGVLGVGGMGVVVAAHHLHLDTRVALKFLLPEMLSNVEAIGRFVREARAAVKITSEHVARVFDVGTLETGLPFLVMELLEGEDLAARLERSGALPVEEVVDFVLQASIAISEAHGLGIVHRDLKPSNLFWVRRADGQPMVKVLDFGISKFTSLAHSPGARPMAVTTTSSLVGSPVYMSPEQMHAAKSADAQSDIWALGVILYELLTARLPFQGETMAEVVLKVTSQPPPPLREARADLPAALEAVVLKCLERDRARRFQNVAELALALVDFAPPRSRAAVERISGNLHARDAAAVGLPFVPSSGDSSARFVGAATASGTTSSHHLRIKAGARRRAWVVVGSVLAAAGVTTVMARVTFRPFPTPAETRGVVGTRASTAPGAAAAPLTSDSSPTPSSPVPIPVANPPGTGVAPEPHDAASIAPAPKAGRAHGAPARSTAPPHDGPSVYSPCDPPFTLDDQGRKHFKPECYASP